jgi:hypothetical protein
LLVKLAVSNRGDQRVDDGKKLVEGRNRDCGPALVEFEGLEADADEEGESSTLNWPPPRQHPLMFFDDGSLPILLY